MKMKSKKVSKNSSEKYEIKFWKDWLGADPIKRLELVKRLPFFDMCLKMENKNFWRNSFSSMLNGYFEDLESAVFTKIRIEKAKRNKQGPH